jgi:hypothetical protein
MMTPKEKTQQILRIAFRDVEREVLFRDATFRQEFEAAETLDDFEAIVRKGSHVLCEQPFQGDGKRLSRPRCG